MTGCDRLSHLTNIRSKSAWFAVIVNTESPKSKTYGGLIHQPQDRCTSTLLPASCWNSPRNLRIERLISGKRNHAHNRLECFIDECRRMYWPMVNFLRNITSTAASMSVVVDTKTEATLKASKLLVNGEQCNLDQRMWYNAVLYIAWFDYGLLVISIFACLPFNYVTNSFVFISNSLYIWAYPVISCLCMKVSPL